MPPMGPRGMGGGPNRDGRYSAKSKPKDMKRAIERLLMYIGEDKKKVFLAIACVLISAGANLAVTYMLKPIING